MDDLAAFSERHIRATVDRITEKAIDRYRQDTQPKATLLAGQPGAGKTVLSSMLSSQYQNNAILINGDDYRRFHPHYRELFERYGADSVTMTSAFSRAVTETLIDELSDRRFNLIVEGTGRTVEVPKKTAELLTGKGYDVRMAAIAVRPEISLLSTVTRFYEMNESGTLPRATAIEAHDRIVDVLPNNLDRIKDLPQIAGLNIWTRELREIYGDATSSLPSDVLREYWCRPWTEDEKASPSIRSASSGKRKLGCALAKPARLTSWSVGCAWLLMAALLPVCLRRRSAWLPMPQRSSSRTPNWRNRKCGNLVPAFFSA